MRRVVPGCNMACIRPHRPGIKPGLQASWSYLPRHGANQAFYRVSPYLPALFLVARPSSKLTSAVVLPSAGEARTPSRMNSRRLSADSGLAKKYPAAVCSRRRAKRHWSLSFHPSATTFNPSLVAHGHHGFRNGHELSLSSARQSRTSGRSSGCQPESVCRQGRTAVPKSDGNRTPRVLSSRGDIPPIRLSVCISAFGDFQQPPALPDVFQHFHHGGGQRAAQELARRQIDRHPWQL